METLRPEIENTVFGWYQTDLTALDQTMLKAYPDHQTGHKNKEIYANALFEKIELRNRINLIINGVILIFTEMLQRLDDSGVILIPDDILHDEIQRYLTYIGIKLGKLEGATLDSSADFKQ